MTEYVKKEDVLALAEWEMYDDISEWSVIPTDKVEELPAADVRENVRGKWVHGREIAREELGDNTVAIFYEDYSCSSCGFKIDRLLWNWDGSLVHKFCPKCGAEMEDENDTLI